MEKKNLSERSAQRLYQMIVVEKQLKPEEKLPNEIELSQTMGVSRTTLREAIRTLAAQGVLEIRRGKGTFVCAKVGEIDDFGFSDLDNMRGQLRDLFELRRIFEPSVAKLACRRASEGEMAEILRCGQGVADCIAQGIDRTQADRDFHAAIVRATHNDFLMRLLPMINQAVSTAIITGNHQEQLAEDTDRDHALLMEFLQLRDEVGAEHAMAIHMHHSMSVMGLGEPE